MEDRTERQRALTQVVHRIARIWSIVTIGLVLILMAGEGVNPANSTEWIEFLFFPVGICVGLILAWWKEGIGGGITTGSLLVFYAIHLITAGTLPKGWAWLAFAAPGFLFLFCWYRSRETDTTGSDTHAKA
jgi:hypothetical protein